MKMVASDETILAAIDRLSERMGYPPSLREVMGEVGLRSTATIKYRLLRMRDKGLVEFEDRKPRTLRTVRH